MLDIGEVASFRLRWLLGVVGWAAVMTLKTERDCELPLVSVVAPGRKIGNFDGESSVSGELDQTLLEVVSRPLSSSGACGSDLNRIGLEPCRRRNASEVKEDGFGVMMPEPSLL